jgi:DNA-binding protein H-NS
MPRLSAEALKKKIADLQKQLIAAESKKQPAINKVKALMKKLGVTLQDLAGGSAPAVAASQGRRGRPREVEGTVAAKKNSSRKVAIKYRDDKGNSWTGRGKTPRWLVEAEKSGKNRADFLI